MSDDCPFPFQIDTHIDIPAGFDHSLDRSYAHAVPENAERPRIFRQQKVEIHPGPAPERDFDGPKGSVMIEGVAKRRARSSVRSLCLRVAGIRGDPARREPHRAEEALLIDDPRQALNQRIQER
jgi:hypothetical protein